MDSFYWVILIFGILCSISSIMYYAPQCWKMFKTKKTSNISYFSLWFAIVSSTIWVIFGILIAIKASIEVGSHLDVVGYPIIVAYLLILGFEIPMLIIKTRNIKHAKARNISEEDYCMVAREDRKAMKKQKKMKSKESKE